MSSHLTRRTFLRAGALGVAGLGMHQVAAWTAAADARPAKSKAVIYIFLSGGLAQLDSFDLKPDAPDGIRGEFKPIATRTPGIQVCEHLPLLAERSDRWALVRSFHHPYPEHSAGHMAMLSGRTTLPPGFDPNKPRATDWPSIAALAGVLLPPRDRLRRPSVCRSG